MRPSFNIAGPCFPDEHYMLPPERRLGKVMELVEEGRYFTLHAGRQTGKTTSAQWLCDHYNEGDRFHAIWVDVETAREQPDPALAFRTLLNALDDAVRRSLPELGPPSDCERLLDDPSSAISRYLRDLAARSPRPLVVFLVARYLDTAGLEEGWLVMFDLRAKLSWAKRLTMKTRKVGKKRIHLVGC